MRDACHRYERNGPRVVRAMATKPEHIPRLFAAERSRTLRFGLTFKTGANFVHYARVLNSRAIE